jgi:succinate dehydrogenase flavin-adding protein (antitoxin of CptAB toxin-antitoxin module)
MDDLPQNVLKFFWGDNLSELNWESHKEYITKTLLEKGDKDAIRWLFERTDKDYLKKIVKEKRLDKKSENFWNLYLS